ncbi:MAG: hypothetical protein WBK37_09530 [Kiritimatiellia bacterium]|nr:hypothetical protein [Kiritimatiellia bacterium]
MSFESGSISFRMVEMPRVFPEDWAARFAAHRAGSLDRLTTGEQRGWVTGRHLLDTQITEETAMLAGWVRLALRRAERKVPAALLKAECRLEELALMAAEGKAYLKAQARAEIRQGVLDRLLPSMPPQLRALPFVYRPGAKHFYVAALPVPQLDVFMAAMQSAVGFAGEPATPEVLGHRLRKTDLRDLPGASFSPEMEREAMAVAPGREFLTWLWFKAETQEGRLALSAGQAVGVLVEGPLTFWHEGQGAYLSVLKKGMPETSMEAKACLLSGKKLKEATITLALDEQNQWKFGLEADEFLIRNLKLPAGEGRLDAASRFLQRMEQLEQWREIFLDLFDAFLAVRVEARKWQSTVADIREWVKARPARR